MDARQQQGFTLLQMILYIGLLSVIVFAAAQVLITLLESREKARVIAEVESEGAYVMELMAQTIRNAEAVAVPVAGGSASSLTLDVVAVADDPTVFAVSSGALTITEGVASAVDLTSSQVTVDTFTVETLTTTDSYGSVRITLTLSYNSSIGRHEYDYTETFTTAASIRW